MRLYHGTDAAAGLAIVREGLRVSTSGFGQTYLVGAALQESRDEAARYRGDRKSEPVVLGFDFEPVRSLAIEPDAWSEYRALHMRALRKSSEVAWQAAVADGLYWTKFMAASQYDCVIIPSTLVAGGGREWIVFEPKKIVCAGIV